MKDHEQVARKQMILLSQIVNDGNDLFNDLILMIRTSPSSEEKVS